MGRIRRFFTRLKNERGFSRPGGVLVSGGVATVAGTVALIIAAQTAPTGDTANLFVDSNGGTCTRQASAAVYSDAAACSTFSAAYAAASSGDVVAVKGGTYASQSITATNKSSGPNITFRPAATESVTVNGLNVEASYATVQDFALNGNDLGLGMEGSSGAHQDVHDVTALRIDGRSLRVYSAYDLLVQNGDWGPVQPDGAAGGENSKFDVAASVTSYDQVQRVTLDGNWFHDYQADDLIAHHIECLAIFSGYDITLTRNKFSNCSVEDVFVKDNGSGGTIGGTFRAENNWFGTARDNGAGGGGAANGEGLVFCTNPPTLYVLNNSFQSSGGFQPDSCSSYPTTTYMQGNYGYALFNVCSYPGTTWTYNAWTNRSACTGTGNVGSVSDYFVSNVAGNAFDLHITSSAAALLAKIPAGSSLLSSPVDIDGDARATNYDIGADER